jgi:glycine/D-amino acid oxidase-like deaminating enzyme
LTELEQTFGREHARAVWDAGRAALWQIAGTVETLGIDCGFTWANGYLHAPVDGPGGADDAALRQEAALAADLGFDARFLDRVPVVGRPGVEFEGQALFHPRKYLAGLLASIPGGGSHVFENTDANEVSGDPLTVEANGHRIRCGYVVLATHTPLMGKTSLASAALFQTKLALYTSYAMGGRLPAGTAVEGAFWDTSDPYLYLRVERRDDHEYLILGGEDHKTGQADDPTACYERLERRFRTLFPGIDITHRWSGQVIETNDGLPFIGETADRQFAATGFAGNGMTFGTLAAMMARDAACGQENPWTDLFHPSRKTVRGGLWDYLRENKDYPYYMVRADAREDDVPRAEGGAQVPQQLLRADRPAGVVRGVLGELVDHRAAHAGVRFDDVALDPAALERLVQPVEPEGDVSDQLDRRAVRRVDLRR